MIIVEITEPAQVYAHSYKTEEQARSVFEAAHAHGAYKRPAEASVWLLRELDDPDCWMVFVVDEAHVLDDFDWQHGKPYPIDDEQAQAFFERRQKAIAGEITGTRTTSYPGAAVSIRDTLPEGTEVRIEHGAWTERPL